MSERRVLFRHAALIAAVLSQSRKWLHLAVDDLHRSARVIHRNIVVAFDDGDLIHVRRWRVGDMQRIRF